MTKRIDCFFKKPEQRFYRYKKLSVMQRTKIQAVMVRSVDAFLKKQAIVLDELKREKGSSCMF